MNKHLAIVGAGHAHMSVLLHLGDYTGRGHRVSVISPSDYHYYSGMGPGMLSGIYRPHDVRFNVKKMAENGGAAFLKDRVVRIVPQERVLVLASGRKMHYDVASFNTGSEVPIESIAAVDERVVPVKPIINLYRARQSILSEVKSRVLELVVVGGGAAGVEISANLWRLIRDSKGSARITLIGGGRILDGVPEKARRLAVESLVGRGIKIFEGPRMSVLKEGKVSLSDGKSLACDYAFLAVGVKPSSLFRDSGLPTAEDGALLVDRHLRSIACPDLFGGGDCIDLAGHSLAKVGVYAVRENPVLKHNLLAALEGNELEAFDPGGSYMLILNMGDGKGILWKDKWVFNGRIAFLLKNFIDKRFMKKFQVSGELLESVNG